MPHSLPVFHIMPVGWDYPGWVGEFYPEDLPEDWRLSYFANEFREVMVPQASWIGGSADQLQSWVDDVSDDFHFFLAISESVDLPRCEKYAEALGANFGGFVGLTLSHTFKAKYQLHTKRELYTAVEACISDPLPAFSQSVGMGLALLFNNDDFEDILVQRGFLEQLQDNVQPDARILLCFAGDPPRIEPIIRLRQLARLMGLA